MGERTLLGLKCKHCGSAALAWLGLTMNQTNEAGCIFCGRLCVAARLSLPDTTRVEIKEFFQKTEGITLSPKLKSSLIYFFSDEQTKRDLKWSYGSTTNADRQNGYKLLNAHCPSCHGVILTRPGESEKVTKERCVLCGKQVTYETYWIAQDTMLAIHEFFKKLNPPMSKAELKTAFRRFFWDDPEKPKTKGWF